MGYSQLIGVFYPFLCFILDYSHGSLLEQTFEEPEPLSPQIQPSKHISSKLESSAKVKTTMAIAIDVESATGWFITLVNR